MKRFILMVTMMVLASTQLQAKEIMDIPSMSGKIEIMEELGLAEHVDPFQYQRAVKKKVRTLTKIQRTTIPAAKLRQVVNLGAGN